MVTDLLHACGAKAGDRLLRALILDGIDMLIYPTATLPSVRKSHLNDAVE
jgi:hypothetical protein